MTQNETSSMQRVVSYLREHPGATIQQVIQDTTVEESDVYRSFEELTRRDLVQRIGSGWGVVVER
jgi:DNA-binding IclR family transcriptional regulator